jgi:TonB family protein
LKKPPSCTYPAAARDAGVDKANVRLSIIVSRTGAVTHAAALADPGHGFAREAVSCVRSARFEPGRDASGRPIESVIGFAVAFRMK